MLVVVVSMLAALSLLATLLFSVISADIRNMAHQTRASAALHQADAGVEYTKACVRADVESRALRLLEAEIDIDYPVPTGFTFDPVTRLTRLPGGDAYVFRVVGRVGQSRAAVEAVIGSGVGALGLIGCFGDGLFELKPGSYVHSYRSGDNPNPTTSTNEATGGSNTLVKIATDGSVTGDVVLGEVLAGDPATCNNPDGPTGEVISRERVDPDPLGLTTGGPLAEDFARVAIDNDNAQAVGGVHVPPVLTITGDVILTAGEYFVDRIYVAASQKLTIDARDGPVDLYLTGAAEFKPNSNIEVMPPLPHSFRLYSNSSASIEFYPKTDTVAFIYAPLAPLHIYPTADFLGAAWGASTYISPGGAFFIDLDFLSDFANEKGPMRVLSWRRVW